MVSIETVGSIVVKVFKLVRIFEILFDSHKHKIVRFDNSCSGFSSFVFGVFSFIVHFSYISVVPSDKKYHIHRTTGSIDYESENRVFERLRMRMEKIQNIVTNEHSNDSRNKWDHSLRPMSSIHAQRMRYFQNVKFADVTNVHFRESSSAFKHRWAKSCSADESVQISSNSRLFIADCVATVIPWNHHHHHRH